MMQQPSSNERREGVVQRETGECGMNKCRICLTGNIERGICVSCGSDEESVAIERQLTRNDIKELEGGPPLTLHGGGHDSAWNHDSSYHGGMFNRGEW